MREHRKRADGTEIDSMKNLAEFVQSFPATGASEPTAPPVRTDAAPEAPVETAPAPEPTTIIDPEFGAMSPDQIIALAKAERARAADLERRASQAEGDLRQQQTQRQIEDTARKVLAEQRAPQAPPQPPAEDPRWKEVDDLWFTEPTKARAIMKQIQTEEFNQTLAAERQKTKAEFRAETAEEEQRKQANAAFSTAMQTLKDSGQQVTQNRVAAVYQTITRRPTATMPNAYFDRGGPLDAGVVVEAFQELFGAPTSTAPAPAAVSTPTIQAPMVAPPGSGRPAPAATAPARARGVSIDANTQRDYEHMAEAFGMDKDKLVNRRRDRLERDRTR